MAKRKIKTYQCEASIVATSNHTSQYDGIQGGTTKKTFHILAAFVAFVVAIAFSRQNAMNAISISEDDAIPTKYDDTSGRMQQQPTKKTQHQPRKHKIVDPATFGGSWSLVKKFSESYDSQGLHFQLKYYFDICERAYDPSKRKVPAIAGHAGSRFDRTSRHKLLHDLEQFDFFLRTDLVGLQPHGRELFGNTIPTVYRDTLARLDQAAARREFDEDHEYYMFTKADQEIFSFYNRALFLPTLPQAQGLCLLLEIGQKSRASGLEKTSVIPILG